MSDEQMSAGDKDLLDRLERELSEGKVTPAEYEATKADILANPTQDDDVPKSKSVDWKASLGGLMILVAVMLTVGVAFRIANAPTVLESAADACEVPVLLATADDGETLTLTGGGERSPRRVEDIGCVLRELEAPYSVLEHISSTRALDGQQTATWDKVNARWSFHPDPGLRITLTVR